MAAVTYHVKVTREGNTWLAEVPTLEGVQTWARGLSRLEAHIREAIALAEDLPEGIEAELDLTFEYTIGDPALDARAAETRAARIRVERDRHELVRSTETLAHDLVRVRGLSVRDAAAMTGVSMQRISQLTRRAPDGRQAKSRVQPESTTV